MGNDRDYGMPKEQFNIDDIIKSYDSLDNDPSLESILAEYKGKAFIAGDKRTPSHILQQKTDEIVKQETGRIYAKGTAEFVNEPFAEEKPSEIKPETRASADVKKSYEEMDDVEKWFEDFVSSKRSATVVEEIKTEAPAKKIEAEPVKEPEVAVHEEVVAPAAGWGSMDFTDPTAVDKFAKELSAHMEKEPIVDDFPEYEAEKSSRRSRIYSDDTDESTVDFLNEASRFKGPIKSLSIRLIAATAVAALMTIVMYLFYAGKSIPFGIGTNQFVVSGVLLIMQLIIMALGIEIFISGITDIVRAEPGAESLLLVSAVMTVLDSFIIFAKQDAAFGLPFCIVTAWAVVFAIWGRKSYYMAIYDSIRMSVAAAYPYGVVSEDDVDERIILKKIQNNTGGFYTNLLQADSGENAYTIAAPLFVVLSFVLAFLASVGHGNPQNFCHSFTVMLAVAAAFPATNGFALPFKYVAKRLKHAGCAVAGWGGANSVYDSDSAIITDEDLFPVGTVSISGVSLYANASQRKAIVYTSSLIIASKSGLSKVFAELLKEQEYQAMRIKDFACYEGGGIGALIEGERVLVGSGAFMNLMGIRVADSINLNNSVFLAVNDELNAVFSVNYIPANSVQNALVSVLNTQVDVLLAVRDFNISPNMIQQKFKVSMEGVKIIPAEVCYKVSEDTVPEDTLASAVLCREGLGPFAEVITSGRLLKKITDVNAIISVASGFAGILLMFFLCWNSAFESASVKNVFLFMMIIEICVILLSKVVKHRN